MKIAKFGHACFVAEVDNQSIIVDPGEFSSDLAIPVNVVAIVITHEHSDHMNPELIQRILVSNPGALIIAHPNVTVKLSEFKSQSINAGEKLTVGNFKLEFFGGQHAIISKEWPNFANLGVLINDKLYYPGDSFTIPDKPVDVLALPIAAPWLKLSEVLAFLLTVRPLLTFPTHDAILSDVGRDMLDRMIPAVAQSIGTIYRRINEIPYEA